MIAAALIAMGVASLSGSYDCELQPPVMLRENEQQVRPIGGFPSTPMNFEINFLGDKLEVSWPDHAPFNMTGKSAIAKIADNAGSAWFYSPGPCRFTDNACGTFLDYAKKSDGTLQILVEPTTVGTNKRDANKAEDLEILWVTAMFGRCTARKVGP